MLEYIPRPVLFAMVCVEETTFEAKRILANAGARCHLQATAASSSGVAQAGEPSRATEVFVLLVGIVDETGRNGMAPIHLLYG
jgi:hypothetical protein